MSGEVFLIKWPREVCLVKFMGRNVLAPTHQKKLATQLACALGEVDGLNKQLKAAQIEIGLLRAKLDALARRMFGKKSEQLSEAQMQLLFQEQTAPGPAEGKASGPEAIETQPLRSEKEVRRTTKRGPRMPEHLPVVEEVIIPEAVKEAPSLWRKIGEEVSEQIDLTRTVCFRHSLCAGLHMQFGIDPFDVRTHRCVTNVQTVGDLLVEISFGEKLQDFLLAVGERFHRACR
jgi:uncharacterized coiled-coil protein SlyX